MISDTYTYQKWVQRESLESENSKLRGVPFSVVDRQWASLFSKQYSGYDIIWNSNSYQQTSRQND